MRHGAWQIGVFLTQIQAHAECKVIFTASDNAPEGRTLPGLKEGSRWRNGSGTEVRPDGGTDRSTTGWHPENRPDGRTDGTDRQTDDGKHWQFHGDLQKETLNGSQGRQMFGVGNLAQGLCGATQCQPQCEWSCSRIRRKSKTWTIEARGHGRMCLVQH